MLILLNLSIPVDGPTAKRQGTVKTDSQAACELVKRMSEVIACPSRPVFKLN